MALLSFLKSATVEAAVVAKKGGGGPRKQRNPNPGLLAIRLWWDGSVYPSQALVDKFDLEYREGTIQEIPAKEAVGVEGTEGYKPATKATRKTITEGGNGFDVIDTKAWSQFKADGRMLLIAAVPKNAGKVDLFSSTTYDEKGFPKSTVMEQGAPTFGKDTLIPMVEAIYGITLAKPEEGKENKEYVDLVVFEEAEGVNISEAFSVPIMYAPKVVTRGADAGKPDYVRRDGATLYGFAPADVVGIAAGTEEGAKLTIEEEEAQQVAEAKAETVTEETAA